MNAYQKTLRLVNWALGMTLFSLAFVTLGLLTCSGTTAIVSTNAAYKATKDSRPLEDASAEEKEDWQERQGPVRIAAYDAAVTAFQLVMFYVGLPTVILLIIISVILRRLRSRLEEGW